MSMSCYQEKRIKSLTVLKEKAGKALGITLAQNLGELGDNLLGNLLGIDIVWNRDTESVGGRQSVVVLEVVHEVIGDGRLGSLLELNMAVNDLGLEVGDVDLVVVNNGSGTHCGNMKVRDVEKCEWKLERG